MPAFVVSFLGRFVRTVASSACLLPASFVGAKRNGLKNGFQRFVGWHGSSSSRTCMATPDPDWSVFSDVSFFFCCTRNRFSCVELHGTRPQDRAQLCNMCYPAQHWWG